MGVELSSKLQDLSGMGKQGLELTFMFNISQFLVGIPGNRANGYWNNIEQYSLTGISGNRANGYWNNSDILYPYRNTWE